MKFSETLQSLRPATFAEKANARLWGSSGGRDVAIPLHQAGWVNVSDGQYTAGSPMVVAAGVKTRITIDGLGPHQNTAFSNGMPAAVWADNQIKPSVYGDVYHLSLSCTLKQTSNGTGHYVEFAAEIGPEGSPIVAAAQSVAMIKGNGVAMFSTIAAPFFAMDSFASGGARLFLTPSIGIQAYGFSLFIQRTFTP